MVKKVKMAKILIDIIKNQALSSENEIYGWLIGYQKAKTLNIVAIIECKKFEFQTAISAIPHAQDFQEISSIMPQGIGPIGIYHSHPFSSEVFHSHTDDSTLISLSKQFPHCVSIVTNGKEVNYYHLNENERTSEILIRFFDTEIPRFLLISLEENFSVKISKEVIDSLDKPEILNVRILNKLREYFEKIWKDIELYCNDVRVLKDEKVNQYLRKELNSIPIELKIPPKLKSNLDLTITTNTNKNPNKISEENDCILFSMKITSKIPIYIHNNNRKFHNLDQVIKTELISNNILQKIYDGYIDFNKKRIFCLEDSYLNYFGFYMRLLRFNDKNLNEKRSAKNTFKLLVRLLTLFEYFKGIELPTKVKNHISVFFEDIEKISRDFYWQDEMITKLKNYRNLLNLNRI